jgi:hypothetical protein
VFYGGWRIKHGESDEGREGLLRELLVEGTDLARDHRTEHLGHVQQLAQQHLLVLVRGEGEVGKEGEGVLVGGLGARFQGEHVCQVAEVLSGDHSLRFLLLLCLLFFFFFLF